MFSTRSYEKRFSHSLQQSVGGSVQKAILSPEPFLHSLAELLWRKGELDFAGQP
jgi:hypothetical protein